MESLVADVRKASVNFRWFTTPTPTSRRRTDIYCYAFTRGALSMQSQEATKLSHILSLKTFAHLLAKKDFQQ